MRRMGLMSIRASALMVVFGVALLFVVPRPAAGLLCMAFGAAGLLVWAVLWPYYKRNGYV